MFTAWLLICALSNQKSWSCYPVQDMRGPYYNRDQCLERVDGHKEKLRKAMEMGLQLAQNTIS